MVSNEIAIKVESISKYYRLGVKDQSSGSLAQALFDAIRSPVRNYRKYRSLYDFSDVNSNPADVLLALKDISFEVRRGDRLGIIGHNGAGKSTLLKILSKITPPSAGQARINGRVSSLLEVGTGFHPELSGRENVYLNGTILGMRKVEIDKKFDEIVDFSGVEQFLDTPVKRYSSGMKVRLAFAVAAHLEPEILIVDEVLAVGDAEFQHKCLKRMDTVSRDGRTILFVSHNMGAVTQLCERALWLDRGQLIQDGIANDVVAAYMSAGMSRHATWEPGANEQPVNTHIRPIKALLIDSVSGKPATLTNFDQPLRIEVHYEVTKASRSVGIAYRLTDMSGNIVYTTMDTDNPDWSGRLREAGTYVSASSMAPFLKPGRYNLTLMTREGSLRMDTYENVLIFDVSAQGCTIFPNRDRKGAVLPVLEWQVRRCDESEDASPRKTASE